MNNMSEEEILKNLYYFTSSKIKNKKLSLQDLCGFDLGYLNVETIQKSVEGLVDLYNKEKEKNKELEHRLKNHVVTKYQIRKIKEEKIQEFRNALYDNTPNSRFKIFGEISILNILLKLKNEK